MSKRIGFVGVGVVFLAVLCLGGCGPQRRGTGAVFTKDGIPAREFLAGGGFNIDYVAPSDGTAYWVEETTQRIMETQSVKKGDVVEFDLGAPEPEEFKAFLGIDIADAKFTLYFVPAEAKRTER